MKAITKNKFFLLLVLLICMLLLPLISVRKNKGVAAKAASRNTNLSNHKKPSKHSYFTVLDEHSNQIIKIPEKKLLCGTVASEMPARFESEALKAQAVASYTYFCHLRETKPKNQNYDFKINPQKRINFITKEQMQKNWGSNFSKYNKKIKNAINEVFPKRLTYKGKPIFASCHAMSSGITEKSSDIFGGELPYLVNVESKGDKLEKNYETKTEFSQDEFKKILIDNNSECKLNGNPKNWVKNYERTKAGTIKQITIGNQKFKGKDLRAFFNLKSSNFVIDYNSSKNKFIIITFGYGHGVGMSQCGANYMAKQGKNYKEILAWYYPNTKLI